MDTLSPMKLLATLKIMVSAICLLLCVPTHASELDEVDGPNVRCMKMDDGSKTYFIRSPDSRTLTKKTYLNGTLTMVIIYKMDSNGNPLGCKIRDGQNQELFKVSYGYHRVTGLVVEELMFDSRVKRINKDTGKEMPVRRLVYLYDAEGKRSAPIAYNFLPGKTYQEVFGLKSSVLDSNPFDQKPPTP